MELKYLDLFKSYCIFTDFGGITPGVDGWLDRVGLVVATPMHARTHTGMHVNAHTCAHTCMHVKHENSPVKSSGGLSKCQKCQNVHPPNQPPIGRADSTNQKSSKTIELSQLGCDLFDYY